MKIKLFHIFLFLILLFAVSCREGGEVMPDLVGDDTDKAVELVKEANQELKKIKVLYKENEDKVENIKIAMKEGETGIIKVRQIAKEAVSAIDDGMRLGNSAIEKIEEAKDLDINDNFRKYLSLKEQSLRKLVEAFEIRRQTASLFSQEFVLSDPEKINKAKNEMIEKEKTFYEIIKEGQDKSREANKLAKDLLQNDDEDF